ncbi:hypothetical protein [Comamonas aquatica]|uniref:hypothetical protein n=1 Tax=Comamonas aquatica TaxID=225991 RepID=UPI00244A535D|nr:hypothetical protein [Comamonas aquatica]MDH1675838.1 phage replisome organizer N-terminal domain-containing protein [Comamonas aquatica]MDH1679490.1 phage replisome organizer N-terminal domain-containing protein [Comamonas aquatica]
MANQWFRLYSEFAHDPKVQMMSEAMQRRYIMLLCLKCADTLDGASDEEIAFSLRISEEDCAKTKEALVKKGLIAEDWSITKWDNRQSPSDSSAERVRMYRLLGVEAILRGQEASK